MTSSELRALFDSYKSYPSCRCETHDNITKESCPKENAWKRYCQARDIYIAKTRRVEKVAGSLFQTFDTD